ncbi:MAG TPA: hypothetical protein VNR17_03595 [Luteimicrobium sp.]|nr:hypothetical protein [Luteimicrobium sp.]
MSRPYDWHPLAATDPVPGEPDVVARAGTDYTNVAEAIQKAAADLRTIADLDAMRSDAVKAIADKAKDVADEIAKVQHRYFATGEALTTYADSLRTAQQHADEALAAAKRAQADYDAAHHKHVVYSDPDHSKAPNAQEHADQAQTDMTTASTALAHARTKLEQATSTRDTAATTAKNAINVAVEADGIHDGWWDNVRSVVNAITDIASKIATVAGVLALALAWVPGLGEALGAVALIAGLVAMAGHGLQLLNGEGSWLDFGLDVLGVATFGLGRIAGATLKMGAEGAQAVSRVRADQLVRALGQTRGVRGAVRGLLNGRGLAGTGIRAAERGVTAFAGRPGLLGSIGRGLNPVTIVKDTAGELKGFGKTLDFLRSPRATWNAAFRDVSGFKGHALAWFGAGDEARALSGVAAADASVRAAANLPSTASRAAVDALAASHAQLNDALGVAGRGAGAVLIGTGVDIGNNGYGALGLTEGSDDPATQLNLN